ncbi:uncharacterized protein VP01_7852g1, partial [Puccinia sorghi]
ILNLIFLYCIEPMVLPPSKKFRSIQKLVKFVRLWARNHGYGISKVSSHTRNKGYICCDCDTSCRGRLKSLAKRNTSTSSPFQ